ncbi:hypothetical protein Pelo_1800 [Pelomyxa schiedti]|nr:hypothetical protein Pelo_1800 [Pelomyxa schiedti]
MSALHESWYPDWLTEDCQSHWTNNFLVLILPFVACKYWFAFDVLSLIEGNEQLKSPMIGDAIHHDAW